MKNDTLIILGLGALALWAFGKSTTNSNVAKNPSPISGSNGAVGSIGGLIGGLFPSAKPAVDNTANQVEAVGKVIGQIPSVVKSFTDLFRGNSTVSVASKGLADPFYAPKTTGFDYTPGAGAYGTSYIPANDPTGTDLFNAIGNQNGYGSPVNIPGFGFDSGALVA